LAEKNLFKNALPFQTCKQLRVSFSRTQRCVTAFGIEPRFLNLSILMKHQKTKKLAVF